MKRLFFPSSLPSILSPEGTQLGTNGAEVLTEGQPKERHGPEVGKLAECHQRHQKVGLGTGAVCLSCLYQFLQVKN